MIQIDIAWGEPGARLAGGRSDLVVLIDALRASTTIACALLAGAVRVIPVQSTDGALGLAAEHGYLTAGERGGAKVHGFDFGNSPSEMLANRERLRGQSLVLSTSNGTRCLHAAYAAGSPLILVGALPNVGAVVRSALELASREALNITLLAAGLDGRPDDEDAFAASVMLQRMVAQSPARAARTPAVEVDERQSRHVFENSEAGGRLSRLGYAQDVAYCANIDVLEVVPIYVANEGIAVLGPELETSYLKGGPGR